MTIMNALRTTSQKIGVFTVPGMASRVAPTSPPAAVDLYFRRRPSGRSPRQRLSDMRELIRPYGRTQAQVFPTGQFFKGGTYGTDVNLSVTTNETEC